EHGEEPVETDSRTIEGSKIESSHGISSLLSEMRLIRPNGPDRGFAHPIWACAISMWGSAPALARGANRLKIMDFPSPCGGGLPAFVAPARRIEPSRYPAIRRA